MDVATLRLLRVGESGNKRRTVGKMRGKTRERMRVREESKDIIY